MKLLSAVIDRTDLHLSIWLDETKVDERGDPDPAWVYVSTWGGADAPGAVDSAIREASLLAEEHLRALTPSAERAKDAAIVDTVELIAEPVELSTARSEVSAKMMARLEPVAAVKASR